MTSSRPYFLRAVYEWLADNSLTPYIMVDANFDSVVVPQDYIEDGKIVLNISMNAVRHLELTNTEVTFQARFQGVTHDIYVPIMAIEAIYAFENGRGMVFEEDDPDTEPPSPEPPKDNNPPGKKKPPFLRVVD